MMEEPSAGILQNSVTPTTHCSPGIYLSFIPLILTTKGTLQTCTVRWS